MKRTYIKLATLKLSPAGNWMVKEINSFSPSREGFPNLTRKFIRQYCRNIPDGGFTMECETCNAEPRPDLHKTWRIILYDLTATYNSYKIICPGCEGRLHNVITDLDALNEWLDERDAEQEEAANAKGN